MRRVDSRFARPWLCNMCLRFDFKRSTTLLFSTTFFSRIDSNSIGTPNTLSFWFIVIVLLFSPYAKHALDHKRSGSCQSFDGIPDCFFFLLFYYSVSNIHFWDPRQSSSVVCGLVDVASWRLIAPTRHIFQVPLQQWRHPASRAATKLRKTEGTAVKGFCWRAWQTDRNVVRLGTAWWWKMGLCTLQDND